MRTAGPGARGTKEVNRGKDPTTTGSAGIRSRGAPDTGTNLPRSLDEEYGGNLPLKVRLSLVTGGLRQRALQSGLVGDSAPAADGIRAGVLPVLAAWTAFVVAGASFAKFSEYFDEALPHRSGAHRVPTSLDGAPDGGRDLEHPGGHGRPPRSGRFLAVPPERVAGPLCAGTSCGPSSHHVGRRRHGATSPFGRITSRHINETAACPGTGGWSCFGPC